jgi:hypothetical protein
MTDQTQADDFDPNYDDPEGDVMLDIMEGQFTRAHAMRLSRDLLREVYRLNSSGTPDCRNKQLEAVRDFLLLVASIECKAILDMAMAAQDNGTVDQLPAAIAKRWKEQEE